MLNKGATAPDFTLKDEAGKTVSLKDLTQNGILVLYFYPKDETPGCTAEACAFRDAFEEFTDAGVQVVGISNDDQASHQKFKEKHNLPFTLLSDENGSVAKKFKLKKTLGFIPARVTFVIDQNQKILHSFDSLFNATKHVKEALYIIQKQNN